MSQPYDPFAQQSPGSANANSDSENGAEDMLFDDGGNPAPAPETSADWAPVEDDWARPKELGSLEDLIGDLGDESAAPVEAPAESSNIQVGQDGMLDQMIGAGGSDAPDPNLCEPVQGGGMMIVDHISTPEEEEIAIKRERLPTASDAPLHPVRVAEESRASAWIIPAMVLVLGGGAGAAMCVTDVHQVVGGIAIALSVVGSLFLRLLLKR